MERRLNSFHFPTWKWGKWSWCLTYDLLKTLSFSPGDVPHQPLEERGTQSCSLWIRFPVWYWLCSPSSKPRENFTALSSDGPWNGIKSKLVMSSHSMHHHIVLWWITGTCGSGFWVHQWPDVTWEASARIKGGTDRDGIRRGPWALPVGVTASDSENPFKWNDVP